MDYINGKAFSLYNAQVSEKTISTTDFNVSCEWNRNSLTPFIVTNYPTFKSISLKILFKNQNRDLIEQDISNLMDEMNGECDFKFNNLSHNYHCFLSGTGTEESIGIYRWMYLNLSLVGYEYGNEITKEFTGSISNINIVGNSDTPCILEITPTQAMIDLTITGFTKKPFKVNNLAIDETVIIDGEKQIITVNGENKFADTEDMWEFPKLKSGDNNISFDKTYFIGKIKYKPRYK